MRAGVGPEGKEGREAVEERQGGDGDLPPPVSSLSWKTWKCKQTLTSFGMCESSVDLVKLVYLACEIGKTGKIVNSVNILEIARILNIMKTMLCRNDW